MIQSLTAAIRSGDWQEEDQEEMSQRGSCIHDVIYWGVTNIDVEGEYLGSIDIWKCRKCGVLSVEEKRPGSLALSPELGFPFPPTDDSKWVVLICSTASRTQWEIRCVKPDDTVSHKCVAEEVQHQVDVNYSIKDKTRLEGVDHNLYVIEEYTNRSLDVHPPKWKAGER